MCQLGRARVPVRIYRVLARMAARAHGNYRARTERARAQWAGFQRLWLGALTM